MNKTDILNSSQIGNLINLSKNFSNKINSDISNFFSIFPDDVKTNLLIGFFGLLFIFFASKLTGKLAKIGLYIVGGLFVITTLFGLLG